MGELPLYQDENMRQKTNSLLTVRVGLSGEGGVGLTDFEKVFHDGEPSFLQKLQEVMTGCVQKKNEHQIQPVKIQVCFLSATGLRNADTAAYAACETHNKAKFDKIRPKTVSETLDLVAIGTEKPQVVEYMPGEALRFAVFDGPKAENAELLGSHVFPSERFWPAGFEGTLQLAEEQSRREKKSNVMLKVKVMTPESALPHQFAAAVKESSGVNGLERFEVEMKELRARMPFLNESDFVWHTRVFEALRDEDWLVQRARLITSADRIFGIPVGHIAGRLFESISPKGQPIGVLDWGMFMQKHRGNSWDAQQERLNLTFTLYDLDGDGMLSLADAISLSSEVVRLEKIYGKESNSIGVCEEMRWLYGLIANAADLAISCHVQEEHSHRDFWTVDVTVDDWTCRSSSSYARSLPSCKRCQSAWMPWREFLLLALDEGGQKAERRGPSISGRQLHVAGLTYLRQLAREAGVSLSEVERYRAMFDEFDTDGSAEISQAEFVFVIMQILGVKDARDIPTPILNRYWQEVDTDGSGEVSFREFLYWMLTKGIG
eukprot:s13_g41.t1